MKKAMKKIKIHKYSIVESKDIGDGTSICSFCYIEKGVRIGANCKIKNGVQIFDGVTLEDDVFVGPNVTFTNVKFPRAYKKADKFFATLVKKGATIGAGSVIVCGITIGKYALIGAGSIVTKDVEDKELFYGEAAIPRGKINVGEI